MPLSNKKSYKFTQMPQDSLLAQLFREAEDNLVGLDENGDIVIDKDIRCRSLYVEGDSLYIGGIKVNSPKFVDKDSYWKYDRENKEVIYTDEVLQSTKDYVEKYAIVMAVALGMP